jgi:hypothetical protein
MAMFHEITGILTTEALRFTEVRTELHSGKLESCDV